MTKLKIAAKIRLDNGIINYTIHTVPDVVW